MSESLDGRQDFENMINQANKKVKELQQAHIDVEKDNDSLNKQKEELLDCVESQMDKIKELEIRIAEFH